MAVDMNQDMDLFELILFSTMILLIFTCFLVTAVFFTGSNLFLIMLSLVFGLLTMPFARTVGGWWTLLKSQERERLKISPDENKKATRWLFLDFGLKGNTRLFWIISLVTGVFGAYNLVRYFTG
jgi:hypothetical protein